VLRTIIEEALLFLIPFGLFALWLAATRRSPLARSHWSGATFWLVIAGLAVALLALVVTGFTAERHEHGFVPTHMENGRVVPGQFR
jgi:hypothetical protein